jgi:hypothetical protein
MQLYKTEQKSVEREFVTTDYDNLQFKLQTIKLTRE